MKKTLMMTAAAAMLMTGFAASAQPHGHRDHGRHEGRRDHHDRYEHRRWKKGERFDHYRSRTYIVSDYRRHGWRAPPRGYAYYRTDSGDVVLAALATGIIASVIANSR